MGNKSLRVPHAATLRLIGSKNPEPCARDARKPRESLTQHVAILECLPSISSLPGPPELEGFRGTTQE